MGEVWSSLCGFVGITQLSKLDHYYILNNLNFVLKESENYRKGSF